MHDVALTFICLRYSNRTQIEAVGKVCGGLGAAHERHTSGSGAGSTYNRPPAIISCAYLVTTQAKFSSFGRLYCL